MEPPTPTRLPATATPRPPDLAVQQVTRLPNGTVRAVIANLGGDLVGFAVQVIVADATTRSESIQAGVGLAAGQAITVQTSGFTVPAEMTVTVTADPAFSIRDADRSNNSVSIVLSP